MEIATETVTSVIGSVVIAPLLQQINDLIHLDENRHHLEEQLSGMRDLLVDISAEFQDQQQAIPVSLNNCLRRMEREVGKGKELIQRSLRPWPQQFIDWLLCKPKVSPQIREWKTTIHGLLNEINTYFQLFCNARQIAASRAPQQPDVPLQDQPEVLLQDQPDTGLIGMKIKEAETQLEKWLTEAPHVQIIGVFGMGGVGKTTLLKKVHNTYKVSTIFDHVIWVTVAQFSILELQSCIASAIGLDLANYCSSIDVDMRKMKLSAHLKGKRFFLILDDMWSFLSLKELGVEFGIDKGSKLVFSTRNKDLIREMKADESIQIQPLAGEEAWELFCRIAFKDGDDVPEDMREIAREVARECQGLPLAINVIASTMTGKADVNVWEDALRQMQIVDLDFPIAHPRIDRELYQRLRLSYDTLPSHNLKSCFLYCAMFMEDANIEKERLLQMWIAEGLVQTRGEYDYENLLKKGSGYLTSLQDRCLFQEVTQDDVSVHDVMRDMGIYIGEKEEKCVFRAGQGLQDFPDIEAPDDCKRISVHGHNLTSLPAKEIRCPKLVSLFLGNQSSFFKFPEGFTSFLKNPEGFFLNFTSLKVLELSFRRLKSLPTSLWQLTKLEFLDLSFTEIQIIPSDIANLSRLQFLYRKWCGLLKSLPREIGKFKKLKYLNIWSTGIRSEDLFVFAEESSEVAQLRVVNEVGDVKQCKRFRFE